MTQKNLFNERMKKMRVSDRASDEMRPVSLEIDVNKHAEGSCLIKAGDTHVLCTASFENRLPIWMRGQNKGWVTAEYGMLPRSTATRMEREAKKGQNGRTQEIQRLIGRSLRSVVDLKAIPDVCLHVDCDVLQADGGTRTASITGGFVAMYLAFRRLAETRVIFTNPVRETVAAVSCGICSGETLLDLDYLEDSTAQTDSNFVMTGSGGLVEIQGTAEQKPFSEEQFNELMRLAKKGIAELTALQKRALGL